MLEVGDEDDALEDVVLGQLRHNLNLLVDQVRSHGEGVHKVTATCPTQALLMTPAWHVAAL